MRIFPLTLNVMGVTSVTVMAKRVSEPKPKGAAVRIPAREEELAYRIREKLNLIGQTLPDIVKLAINRLAEQERVA